MSVRNQPINVAADEFLRELDAIELGAWGTPCTMVLLDGRSFELCLAWENPRYSDAGTWINPNSVAYLNECPKRMPARFALQIKILDNKNRASGQSGLYNFRASQTFAKPTILPSATAEMKYSRRSYASPTSEDVVDSTASSRRLMSFNIAFKTHTPVKAPTLQPTPTPRVLVNEPLDFVLKNLDTRPQYLLNRGFTPETIDHFGLAYCTKGTFAGRIVIPLHDLQGRLIGYAGRLIFDEAIDEENLKYLFPPSPAAREDLEFSKTLFVYHGHAFKAPVDDLVVVQGFPDYWWVWQQGYRNVVALVGATCSVHQANAIITLTNKNAPIWCFTDSGAGGEECGQNLFAEVGMYRFCKRILPKQGQPGDS